MKKFIQNQIIKNRKNLMNQFLNKKISIKIKYKLINQKIHSQNRIKNTYKSINQIKE